MISLKAKSYKLQAIRGAATLPVVLIVSAIIMEVAITSVLIANIFGNTTFNSRIASESLATAEAGANDAIIKVVRYCPIGSVGLPGNSGCASPYSLAVDTRTAVVLIKDELDGAGQPTGNKIVISSSTILNRVKRVEAKLAIDQLTGATDIKSFKECYNYDSVQGLCTE